jgi:hypothetical protein
MNDDQTLSELQLWMSDLIRRRRALDRTQSLPSARAGTSWATSA